MNEFGMLPDLLAATWLLFKTNVQNIMIQNIPLKMPLMLYLCFQGLRDDNYRLVDTPLKQCELLALAIQEVCFNDLPVAAIVFP